MDDNYLVFRNDDLLKSKKLAEKLNIFSKDIDKIQIWFDLLLLKHQQCDDFNEQVVAEKILENKFLELISSEIEEKSCKYILPKLLNYNNIFHGAFLKSLFIPRLSFLLRENLIPKLIENVKYNSEEFLSLTTYLKNNFFVSPNSNLIESVLLIEKKNKILFQKKSELNLDIIKNILNVIKEKGFHHDIISFRKILKKIDKNNLDEITFLKEFSVENNQGCYLIISALMNQKYIENNDTDFEIKIQLLDFLDSARGAKPKESWCNKFSEIQTKLQDKDISQLVHLIKKNSRYAQYILNDGSIWTDDVATRFIKSANWIEEKACR